MRTILAACAALALACSAACGGPSRADDAGALAARLASIPASAFHSVGIGSVAAFPLEVSAPSLTTKGKPRVLYMGAEYCPYCATERWGIVAALSRFGSFRGLRLTHSASDDVLPDTQTFTFHGSRFESPYVVFEAVEMKSNQPANGSYGDLETPTAEQRQLMQTYGGPPYFAPSSSGGIPFVDIAGRYVVSGASYDPTVLQGKSANQIASDAANPGTSIAQGVLGTANALTAAICGVTAGTPTEVCSDPVLASITPRFK